ncbi:Uncharacterised protein [BD1-7 clade bacterium]|uniref:Uncharacterized protein n=1 Tax=BD1-7 clade bacterium TaxID=2029982 RepID=A0A5S9Q6R2_9GAMM|nr:Uncharacterised protein [BD1-7 clade bacterium]
MANNIIKFPSKTGKAANSGTKEQGTDKLEKVITSDLRAQLRNECRTKHGFTESNTE